MKQCEICGTTEGQISGKTGKFGMDLCMRHYVQMGKYGEITDNKPAVKTLEYKGNYLVVEADYETIEVNVIPKEYKIVNKEEIKIFNRYRNMAIEIMELCSGIKRDPRIMDSDWTRFLPQLVEDNVIKEVRPGVYRLTKEYAEPM